MKQEGGERRGKGGVLGGGRVGALSLFYFFIVQVSNIGLRVAIVCVGMDERGFPVAILFE